MQKILLALLMLFAGPSYAQTTPDYPPAKLPACWFGNIPGEKGTPLQVVTNEFGAGMGWNCLVGGVWKPEWFTYGYGYVLKMPDVADVLTSGFLKALWLANVKDVYFVELQPLRATLLAKLEATQPASPNYIVAPSTYATRPTYKRSSTDVLTLDGGRVAVYTESRTPTPCNCVAGYLRKSTSDYCTVKPDAYALCKLVSITP
jgi:hypothetical protein